jgi:hypothetical protein
MLFPRQGWSGGRLFFVIMAFPAARLCGGGCLWFFDGQFCVPSSPLWGWWCAGCLFLVGFWAFHSSDFF